MTLDLVALILVAFFALFGALSGFSKQVAQAIAGVLAVIAATPAGRFFAEPMAKGLQSSLTVGLVAATIISFVLVYLVVRLVITAMLKRMLDGKDPERPRSTDRTLGLLLGASKAAIALWIGASAATFIENNLVLNGKKYTFTPKDSKLMSFSRSFNFIETLQFSGGKDLALAAKVAADPAQAEKLKDDPDYAALMKDPRFKKLVAGDAWKKALETGDIRGLVQSNDMVELMQDSRMSHHLEKLADRAD